MRSKEKFRKNIINKKKIEENSNQILILQKKSKNE